MIFGLHAADSRLITLGASGIVASTLMLARIHGPRDVSNGPARERMTRRQHSAQQAGPRAMSTRQL